MDGLIVFFPNNFRTKFSILVHYGVVSWEKLDSAAIRASNLHSDSSNPTVDLLKATTASSWIRKWCPNYSVHELQALPKIQWRVPIFNFRFYKILWFEEGSIHTYDIRFLGS